MVQSGGFLGRILDPLLKTGLPLIKNVIKPLIKLNKKGISIVNEFQKILNDSASSEAIKERKLNKIWGDKGSEFYDNSF